MRWNVDHGLLTFLCNFLPPQQDPMGRLLPRYDLRNTIYFVEKLNEALADELKRYQNAFLFDFDQITSTFGRKYFHDDVLVHTNHGSALTNSDLDGNRLERVDAITSY